MHALFLSILSNKSEIKLTHMASNITQAFFFFLLVLFFCSNNRSLYSNFVRSILLNYINMRARKCSATPARLWHRLPPSRASLPRKRVRIYSTLRQVTHSYVHPSGRTLKHVHTPMPVHAHDLIYAHTNASTYPCTHGYVYGNRR